MIRKIKEKLRQGLLRDILRETRWIYRCAARYKKAILIYILLGLFSTLLGLGSSIATKYLIDAVTGHHDSVILGLAALYAGFSLARIAMNAVSSRVSVKLNIKASNEIRADVFGQFLDVDWQASLDYHSGDLLSRINTDVDTVSGSVLGLVPSLIIDSVQFLATLTVIVLYDPIMAVIALLSAPVTVLLSRVLLKKMRAFSKKVREIQARLTAFYEEALQNLQAIKSFHLNREFCGRLDELQGLYKNISLDYNLFSVKTNLLLSTLGFLVSGLCFVWAVYRLWSGYISFGTMLLFIQLAGLVSSSFSALVSLVPSAVSATVSAGRIMTILSLPHEDFTVSPEAKAILECAADSGAAVNIDHVRFSYPNGHPVFLDATLQAAPGEIIGIVSPSGGGKTTLIRMLLGLIAPEDGTLSLSGGGFTAPLSPCMRSLIAYVAQEKVVFSGSIADSLRLGNPLADEVQLRQALEAACAWEFVSRLPAGMDTPLGERGSGLSEGQIQRLAIARAYVSPAPILLLDEATSALDMETERKVLDNLLRDGKRRTVLVTTHRPTVLRSCTRIYSIENCRTVLLSAEQAENRIMA